MYPVLRTNVTGSTEVEHILNAQMATLVEAAKDAKHKETFVNVGGNL